MKEKEVWYIKALVYDYKELGFEGSYGLLGADGKPLLYLSKKAAMDYSLALEALSLRHEFYFKVVSGLEDLPIFEFKEVMHAMAKSHKGMQYEVKSSSHRNLGGEESAIDSAVDEIFEMNDDRRSMHEAPISHQTVCNMSSQELSHDFKECCGFIQYLLELTPNIYCKIRASKVSNQTRIPLARIMQLLERSEQMGIVAKHKVVVCPECQLLLGADDNIPAREDDDALNCEWYCYGCDRNFVPNDQHFEFLYALNRRKLEQGREWVASHLNHLMRGCRFMGQDQLKAFLLTIAVLLHV